MQSMKQAVIQDVESPIHVIQKKKRPQRYGKQRTDQSKVYTQ
jgi:hypothetical protein